MWLYRLWHWRSVILVARALDIVLGLEKQDIYYNDWH